MTKDNKGVYTWPKTVAGHLVQLPCAVDDTDAAQASYMCTQEGTWELLTTENCPFASETTRILEQFSKVSRNGSGFLFICYPYHCQIGILFSFMLVVVFSGLGNF